MRWIAFLSWLFGLIAFLLSLITFLLQLPGSKNDALTIATFNTSYLGLAEYHDTNSSLHRPIGDLLPIQAHHSPSITRYLGLGDWYSWSYLSVCSGHYAISQEDPTLLSASKTNITCSKQKLGYTFSLDDILRKTVDPSVVGIVDQLPDNIRSKRYGTHSWIGLWIVGILTAFLNTILIPFAWKGTRRINFYIAIIALISFLALDLSAILITRSALLIQRDALGSYGHKFQALTWSASAIMIVSFFLAAVEWNFEWWTPKGERITIYWKPKDISWWDWKPARPRSKSRTWDARRGL